MELTSIKKYPGVYAGINAKGEKIFYIIYRVGGGRGERQIKEPAGKANQGMTAAKAAIIRANRIQGKELSNTAKRQAEAEAKAADLSRWTLNRIWEAYKDAHPEHRSRDRDESRYKTHIEPRFGECLPEEMDTTDIDKMKVSMRKNKKSDSTIQRVISQLRAVINFAVKRGYCPALNPSKLIIESIRVDDKKTEVLTDEQLKNLLKALDAEVDQNAAGVIRLALFTGMRKGALLGLRWTDIDFENNFITLRGENAKNGKTDKIPLNRAAREVLLNITQTSEFVFPGRGGRQRTDYRRIARRVKKVAGLPENFRPLHGLRHNFASRIASSGKVDMYTLQQLMTHHSPQMTQRYAKLHDEALKRAGDVAANVLDIPTDN